MAKKGLVGGRIYHDTTTGGSKKGLVGGLIVQGTQAGAEPPADDVFILNKVNRISDGVGPVTAAQLQGVLIQ